MANLTAENFHLHLTDDQDKDSPTGQIEVFENVDIPSGSTIYSNNSSQWKIRVNVNASDTNTGVRYILASKNPSTITNNYQVKCSVDETQLAVGDSADFTLDDDGRKIGSAYLQMLRNGSVVSTLNDTLPFTFTQSGSYICKGKPFNADTSYPYSLSFTVPEPVAPPLFSPGTSYDPTSTPLKVRFLIIPNVGVTYTYTDFDGYFDNIDGVQRALKPVAYSQTAPPNSSDVDIFMSLDDSGSMGSGFNTWLEVATENFISDLPNGTYITAEYYHQGVKVNQVMDDTLRNSITSIIGAPASGMTPLYLRANQALSTLSSSSRSIKYLIVQTDGLDNASGTITYQDVITSAVSDSTILYVFSTGTSGDVNLRKVPNDTTLSARGSTYYEATTKDDQIGAFRGISAILTRPTGYLECEISVDSNPSSASLTVAQYPSGLSSNKYTGTINSNDGKTQPFKLFV